MNNLDRELSQSFGIQHNWTQVIRQIVELNFNYAKNAQVEDVETDIISDFVVNMPDQLKLAIGKAKQTLNPTENVAKVVKQAVRFRVSDARRKINLQKSRYQNFQDYQEENILDNHSTNEFSFDELQLSIEKQLELLKQAATWQKNTQLANRIEKAKQVLPHRLNGESLTELMIRFSDVKSKATMNAILDHIKQAFKNTRKEDYATVNG